MPTIFLMLLIILQSGCAHIENDANDQNLMRLRSAYVESHPELPWTIKQAILSGNLSIGMTKEQVVAALGQPEKDTSKFNSQYGETENWNYRRYPFKGGRDAAWLWSDETQAQICVEYFLTFFNGLLQSWNHYDDCQGMRG